MNSSAAVSELGEPDLDDVLEELLSLAPLVMVVSIVYGNVKSLSTEDLDDGSSVYFTGVLCEAGQNKSTSREDLISLSGLVETLASGDNWSRLLFDDDGVDMENVVQFEKDHRNTEDPTEQ